MSPAVLLISFFLFTMAAVSAAGYVLLLRPSEAETEAPVQLLSQPEISSPQAAVLDIFRLIGNLIPDRSKQRTSARKLLLLAGYRWPSAVSSFLGYQVYDGFYAGSRRAWASLTFDSEGSPSIASLAGIGIGFLAPDRILHRIARLRGDRLRRGLPAALDLMVLAVEAGQSVDASDRRDGSRTARELSRPGIGVQSITSGTARGGLARRRAAEFRGTYAGSGDS
ncbi:MAG: hypothetical protein WDO18_15820 [Acidobacteriota bacterium]